MNPAESHCSSYYAASRNDTTEYPPLQSNERCDVCVIGAGFTGLSAALTLAERGYSVIVLEQHKVGWGASGRCGGQIIGGVPGEAILEQHGATARDLFEIGYRGHDLVRDRVVRYGIDCDLKPGYIDVALKERQLERQQTWYEANCAQGMEDSVRLVGGEELSRMLGTDRYCGGLLNTRSGHLHPLNLCLGEARAAAGLGVAIHEDSAVTRIIHGDSPEVVTAGGSVQAESVILACNAYQHIEKKLVTGRLFPAPSFIVATEPLTDEEVASVNPQDVAVCDQNMVPDYFRLSADRRLLFGGGCNYSGFESRSIERGMRPRLRRVYPQLASKRLDFAWGGNVGIVVNRVPLVGRLGGNVYYAMGYSGHGVSLSHCCGEVIADAVGGTLERMDVFARVPSARMPLGGRVGGSLVALGMLYYRLRDLL